LKLFVILKNNC